MFGTGQHRVSTQFLIGKYFEKTYDAFLLCISFSPGSCGLFEKYHKLFVQGTTGRKQATGER